MKSSQQRAPNRTTSISGTGVRTARGRVRAVGAPRQGLFAAVDLGPEPERSADWARHHAGVIENLKPAGTLEEALADRAALLSWELNRVTRERDAAAKGGLPREADPPRSLARHEEKRRERGALLSVLESLEEPTDQPLEREVATAAFSTLRGEAAEVAARCADRLAGPDAADVLGRQADGLPSESDGWTTRRLRAAAEALARAAGFHSWEGLWHRSCARVWRERQSAEDRIAEIRAATERLRRERLLRTSSAVDEASRQASALERSLYRTLHELEHLQARRPGDRPSAPAAEKPVHGEGACRQLSLA